MFNIAKGIITLLYDELSLMAIKRQTNRIMGNGPEYKNHRREISKEI